MILKAEVIWAGHGNVIRDGGIQVIAGKIAQIGPFSSIRGGSERIRNVGDTILMPALVNAHTHLDLSHLEGKLEKGAEFSQWLKYVARARAFALFEGRSIRKGISNTTDGGAAAVGDISVSGKSAVFLRKRGLDSSVVFLEAIGPDPAKAVERADELRDRIIFLQQKDTVRIGISPHAPYTVSAELFQRCLAIAHEYGLPLAIHTAETASEVEFLLKGTGKLRALMDTYHLLPPDWKPPGRTPVAFLRHLGALERRPLLIHCNVLDDADVEAIARSGCPVAYCPRSNAFFRRTGDSLKLLLDAGVKVALGTDSFASNESLSMLDEMHFLRQRYPELDGETILDMATANAAAALGIEHGGALREGMPADIVAVRPGPGDTLPARVLAAESSIAFTMSRGRQLRGRSCRRGTLAET